MANCCFFTMAIKGFKNEQDKKFVIDMFNGKDKNHWLALQEDTAVTRQGKDYLVLDGDCKWNIHSAMLDDRSYAEGYYPIDELAKDFDLDIEVYSEECGFGFQEHVIIKGGQVVTDETEDYEEVYLHDSYDEFIREEYDYIDRYGKPTPEEWDEMTRKYDEYLHIGGFPNWHLGILEGIDEQDL